MDEEAEGVKEDEEADDLKRQETSKRGNLVEGLWRRQRAISRSGIVVKINPIVLNAHREEEPWRGTSLGQRDNSKTSESILHSSKRQHGDSTGRSSTEI